ncbi:MAG: hypothetical protein WDN28_19210 [Chthoniobacter sp.]
MAASLSAAGASRQVFDLAPRQPWQLLVSPWVLREVRDNLADKPADASRAWAALREQITIENDELIFDWPLDFDVAKDKPVLITALLVPTYCSRSIAAISATCSARRFMNCGCSRPANSSAPSARPAA